MDKSTIKIDNATYKITREFNKRNLKQILKEKIEEKIKN